MKKNRIIAMLLGTALLVCGCQQTSKATDEEKKIESEKNTTKTEENAYQGKLDLITPEPAFGLFLNLPEGSAPWNPGTSMT